MVDHLAHRLLGGVVEVFVKADGHQMGLILGKREIDLHVLAHGQPERAGQADFQRGDADLAVTLHAMAVARHE